MLEKYTEDIFKIASLPETRQSALERFSKGTNLSGDERTALKTYLLSEIVLRDLQMLKEGNYYFDEFTAKKRNIGGKERLIFSLPFEQKTIIRLINYGILLRYSAQFSKDLYSFKIGGNQYKSLESIRSCSNFKDLYLFKTDIKSYGRSIVDKEMCHLLDSFFAQDIELCAFLKWYVKRNTYYLDDVLYEDAPVTKDGLSFSGLFENIYLTDLDSLMEKEADYYSRFGDDILIGAANREKLDELIGKTKNIFDKKGLTMHPMKTSIIFPGERFEHLGVIVEGSSIDLSEDYLAYIERRIRKRARKLAILQRKKRLPKEIVLFRMIQWIETLKSDIEITQRYSFITTDKSLKKIDRMLTDLIRGAAAGTTGRKKYQVSYKELSKWGYKSLVREYYEAISCKK